MANKHKPPTTIPTITPGCSDELPPPPPEDDDDDDDVVDNVVAPVGFEVVDVEPGACDGCAEQKPCWQAPTANAGLGANAAIWAGSGRATPSFCVDCCTLTAAKRISRKYSRRGRFAGRNHTSNTYSPAVFISATPC